MRAPLANFNDVIAPHWNIKASVLTECQFTNAVLEGSQLTDCDFSKSQLTQSNLCNCDMQRAL